MSETRVFGTKEDINFWSDKPIQPGHPKYINPKTLSPKTIKVIREELYANLSFYEGECKDIKHSTTEMLNLKKAIEEFESAYGGGE